MARPIKETPVITGKDEKRFAEKMANLKFESKEEKEAAKKVYEKFKSIAAFTSDILDKLHLNHIILLKTNYICEW